MLLMVSQHYRHKGLQFFYLNYPFNPATILYNICCALEFHGEEEITLLCDVINTFFTKPENILFIQKECHI